MKHLTIHIIGYGRVGQLMHRSLESAGFTDLNVIKRDEALPEYSQLVFICTPDAQIGAVAEKLAQNVEHGEDMIVIHCSGTLPSSVLQPLANKGAGIGCFHPMKAITEEAESLHHSWFDIEGEPKVLKQLELLAGYLGAKTLRVSADQKKKLHAAAVVASNYLVTLTEAAIQIAGPESGQQEEMKKALLSLMESTLGNLTASSPAKALTGPLKRGDVDTIREHVKLLQTRPGLLKLYRDLGVFTLDMVKEVHSEELTDQLKQVLGESR